MATGRTEKAARAGLRVLHVVDSLGLGGAQTILKDYFEYRADDRTIFLYGLRALPRQVEISHPNVTVYQSPARFSFAPLVALRRNVRREAVDVLHCHLFRAQVHGYILKALFFPRIALVFHEHGRVVGREGESALEALAFRLFLRLAWRRVDCFVCNSDHTRLKLLQLIAGAESRTRVVVNPIPTRLREQASADAGRHREALGVPEGAFVVGFASRLVETKGWRTFLEAVQDLSSRLPVYFLIAGDGVDRDKVEACIRDRGIDSHGSMLGHIDRMDRFYRALDCFVMPSHWESHGLSHLEAQSFGVPVVVSRVPGLEDTVHADEDALLFSARDPKALADCVFRIASDQALRARLAAAGPANASRYTIEAFSSGLEGAYSAFRGAKAGAE